MPLGSWRRLRLLSTSGYGAGDGNKDRVDADSRILDIDVTSTCANARRSSRIGRESTLVDDGELRTGR